jgi:hypothetical protein
VVAVVVVVAVVGRFPEGFQLQAAFPFLLHVSAEREEDPEVQ